MISDWIRNLRWHLKLTSTKISIENNEINFQKEKKIGAGREKESKLNLVMSMVICFPQSLS